MVDSPPQKNDEQYPLLKMETGGGDISRPHAPASPPSPGFNVTCSTRRTWLDRWPEFFSACWMSGMLLGLFFLIMYGLGLGVIRRQPIFFMNCNGSKPGSEVYYHDIIQMNEPLPIYFSEYILKMASTYPSLQHNLIFLLDDSKQESRNSKRHLWLNLKNNYHKLLSYSSIKDDRDFGFLIDFPNVNVTIKRLSDLMASTPLRYKWRSIPRAYLAFYARVISIWQTGGIGIDPNVFSNQFLSHEQLDRKVDAILKQHNNGINADEYSNTLTNIDRDEQNEISSLLYGLMNQLLKETKAFFNQTILFSLELADKDMAAPEPLIRTHRNKREIPYQKETTRSNQVNDIKQEKNKQVNATNEPIRDTPKDVTPNRNDNVNITDKFVKSLASKKSNALSSNRTSSNVPGVFTMFEIFTDNMGFVMPKAMMKPYVPQTTEPSYTSNRLKPPAYLLSLTGDGSFIAASCKHHPFLAHIITAGCQRMPPKIAIQDAVLNQCSSFFKDDLYCNNIYII